MDEETNQKEQVNVVEFAKSLNLSNEDKYKLVGCFSVIATEAHNAGLRRGISAAIGLSEDDPSFNAVFSKDIEEYIDSSFSDYYHAFKYLIIGEEDNDGTAEPIISKK